MKRKIMIIVLVMGVILSYLIYQNKNIQISHLDYQHSQIPPAFDGFTICQISDLHNAQFGENQQDLISAIAGLNPDLIAVTGDLIDRRKYNLAIAMQFIEQAAEIAPIYYVSGNHEAWVGHYDTIKQQLTAAGVLILDDAKQIISLDGQNIELIGLSDPALAQASSDLAALADSDQFQILLAHRPELFAHYAEHDIDLILSGHAHGGQIRLPLIGGLIAPNQGLFPAYDSGLYHLEDSTMYVSRGLGNSVFPLRINNRPEIVLISLHSE